jgi:20S proteasome alpha/beta subunit
MRWNIHYCSIILILTGLVTVRVQGAHSKRRVVLRREVERYDREITTFSEDGTLAQVEYGMEASLRGSTVAAIQTPSGICLVVQNSSFGKVHRLDHHLWLVTAGLSGDARILADALRNTCQKHRLSYGEAPTTDQIARVAGELQHELTRTGGARPLGCTAIVLGIDAPFDGTSMGKPTLFQTDPGGIVEECFHCAAGKERTSVGKIVATLATGKRDNLRNFFAPLAKKNVGQNTDQLSIIATTMAEKVLNQLDHDSKGSTVDVWIIRPNSRKRGGMQATCYRNIKKDSLAQISEGQ